MIKSGKFLTKGRLFPIEEMKLTKADLWVGNFLPEQVLMKEDKIKTTIEDFYSKTFKGIAQNDWFINLT